MAPEPVAYSHAGLALTGELFRPEGPAKAAVLVIPTIAGPNPPIRRRGEMLAGLGYLTFIADYYGRPWDSFANPDDVRAAANALKVDARYYRDRFLAARDAFLAVPAATRLRMAIIGYCMGGQVVVELLRDGAEFACAVTFHGILEPVAGDAGPAITTPLLVCHGQADPFVPPMQVRAFKAEMDAAGADWTMLAHAQAQHGFTDRGSDRRGIDGITYDRAADHISWATMQAYFTLHMPQ